MSEFRKRMATAIDKQIMSAITGTSATNSTPQEPLTVDTIRRAMLKMPPRETWLSSRLFPSDRAITVEGSGERFTCASPGFWARVEDALRKSDQIEKRQWTRPPLGMNLSPIEIDPWPEDAPDTAKWRAAHWDRLREAFEVALTPLPDWLKGRPKFSSHG